VNDLGVTVTGEPVEGSSPADDVVAEISAIGGTARADGTSVTDWEGMGKLVAATVDRFGDLHAVVNNAGFLRDRMLVSMSEDEWDAVVTVHVKGTAALTKHACAYWRDRARAGAHVTGRVVMTTSGSVPAHRGARCSSCPPTLPVSTSCETSSTCRIRKRPSIAPVGTVSAMGYRNVLWGGDYPHLEGTFGHGRRRCASCSTMFRPRFVNESPVARSKSCSRTCPAAGGLSVARLVRLSNSATVRNPFNRKAVCCSGRRGRAACRSARSGGRGYEAPGIER
jgi:NAD(P)-dependent dehydrogenase (short-subunit alcohol dehydrogenase family)